MDQTGFRALLQPLGSAALAAAQLLEPREASFLRHFQTLQRQFPAPLARAALETAILRLEAQEKFPFAGDLFFTRAALEQASGAAIARQRALRFAGAHHIIDAACSIGGDTLALAEAAPTTGIDLDRLRLEMAQANARARAALPGFPALHAVNFLQADLLAELPVQVDHQTGIFFDPARRSEGRRIYSVADYQPPLRIMERWRKQTPMLGVKLSPGVKIEEILTYSDSAEVEFVSVNGDLKEAALWFGPLRTAARRATLLPGGATLAAEQPFRTWLERSERKIATSPPRAYLYEPDPAVIRAGLVEDLALLLDAAQLDADIAYLTAHQVVPTPFARCWQVLEWLPFQRKRLRAALVQRDVGRLIVKKRGSPIQPEELIRQLRLEGSAEATVFLTHFDGKPIALITEPVTRS